MPDRYGKLELRHLRYFVAVAEEGSVSKAARLRLHTAQPSLSRQLREMENELGVRLFERRPRGVALTPSGQRFLEHCRDILARLDEAVNDTRGTRTILRLGCLAGLEPDILPRVTQLAKSHAPEVEVQVVSAPSPRLVELLRARELDFALMRREEGAVDLDFKTVALQPVVVLLPADHRLARQDSVAFRDLQTQRYIAAGRQSAPAVRDAVDNWCQQQSLTLTPSHTVNDFAAGLSLILTTHGFGLMPDYGRHLVPPAIAVRPLVGGPPPLPLVIAWRPKNATPARSLVKAITADWNPD
jgi:LysR family hca operon transcriptional activator